jgi:hypothetical protein
VPYACSNPFLSPHFSLSFHVSLKKKNIPRSFHDSQPPSSLQRKFSAYAILSGYTGDWNREWVGARHYFLCWPCSNAGDLNPVAPVGSNMCSHSILTYVNLLPHHRPR